MWVFKRRLSLQDFRIVVAGKELKISASCGCIISELDQDTIKLLESAKHLFKFDSNRTCHTINLVKDTEIVDNKPRKTRKRKTKKD